MKNSNYENIMLNDDLFNEICKGYCYGDDYENFSTDEYSLSDSEPDFDDYLEKLLSDY